MIENFGNGCVARKNADRIERKCEEVFAAITHEPSTATQIAERGNIMRTDYRYGVGEILVPNYQRVAREIRILMALGLVKKTQREIEVKFEYPEHKTSVMIIDKQEGNKLLDFHWENETIPASKHVVKKVISLYSLAN